jgi:hypothetical protein
MAQQDDPVIKGDIAQLTEVVNRVDQGLSQLGNRVESVGQKVERLDHKVTEFKDQIIRHFDVIAEELRHDLIGARSDEVEVLKDGRKDHERRIRTLEKHAGIIAA